MVHHTNPRAEGRRTPACDIRPLAKTIVMAALCATSPRPPASPAARPRPRPRRPRRARTAPRPVRTSRPAADGWCSAGPGPRRRRRPQQGRHGLDHRDRGQRQRLVGLRRPAGDHRGHDRRAVQDGDADDPGRREGHPQRQERVAQRLQGRRPRPRLAVVRGHDRHRWRQEAGVRRSVRQGWGPQGPDARPPRRAPGSPARAWARSARRRPRVARRRTAAIPAGSSDSRDDNS